MQQQAYGLLPRLCRAPPRPTGRQQCGLDGVRNILGGALYLNQIFQVKPRSVRCPIRPHAPNYALLHCYVALELEMSYAQSRAWPSTTRTCQPQAGVLTTREPRWGQVKGSLAVSAPFGAMLSVWWVASWRMTSAMPQWGQA